MVGKRQSSSKGLDEAKFKTSNYSVAEEIQGVPQQPATSQGSSVTEGGEQKGA